jgi:hypothetical protein
MTKILLIIASLLVVGCGEKVSTDTVQLSKDFMQALIVMDKETLQKIKRPYAGSNLNIDNSLPHYHNALKKYAITVDELKYTLQKGNTENVECVVVQSNGSREGNANFPMVNWRLKFTKPENKDIKGLLLYELDSMYGHFTDKGCRE